METVELIAQIFQICIIPLLGVLTTFAVKWIRAKMGEMKVTTDSALCKKYMTMLEDTITSCVIATNQTYVEALKKQGTFDTAAQKAAFEATLNAVMAILGEDAKSYLTSAVGDLNIYISKKIEEKVNENKPVITPQPVVETQKK